MGRPIVTIVGRPNVGKSTLFNRIAGKRISITEDTPGVTRDRIYAECEWLDNYFTLIDTGGIEPNTTDTIFAQMRIQAEVAIEMADVVLFMVDGKEGVTAADTEVAQMLRKAKKEIILVVNKMDRFVNEDSVYEFYNLGLGDPIPISSAEALGIGDLLDEIISKFNGKMDTKEEEDSIKIAVIGKPNAGKSSIINRIIGEERVIVSDIPGTTRDAIDTKFERNSKKYTLIDTAGIRKKSKVLESVEKYSVLRAFTAVERADICVLVIDADKGVTEQDIRIAGYSHDSNKGMVIVINKWDLIEKDNSTFKEFTEEIRQKLAYATYAPILTVSALTGQRVNKILEVVDEIYSFRNLRISTGVLNDILTEAVLMNQPATVKGKRLKIYYGTQVAVNPPKFLIFVNDKEIVHFSYERYIENKIREAFEYKGTPIIIEFRNRSEK
ncbi:MAG TPA: ribosome biogenesis GTPase Der [Sedimentibacter sp.]|jgi:GTP-binding protein|nr:ribosome biogenesis GTPase Der [Sedimentibacter sp.]NLA12642.1 ribosome biogenesis GTPase Der [Tissierellia bacterium]HAS91536.1 ribosome biogenesis GTPase Der [Clostridiales bacterium]HOG62106.1 ribosome biogenesis GTPase Der [Sedimentibacter sp.]HOT22629.1 ribosome biogenesis GTPase Der [Sedimentibacter sp.]